MVTTPTQTHRNSNTHRTKNNTTNVVIQQISRKLLMINILISETCWTQKKWNKIASDIKLVFDSSTITHVLPYSSTLCDPSHWTNLRGKTRKYWYNKDTLYSLTVKTKVYIIYFWYWVLGKKSPPPPYMTASPPGSTQDADIYTRHSVETFCKYCSVRYVKTQTMCRKQTNRGVYVVLIL